MTAERWAQLAPLVDAALDLPPVQRAGYIEALCATDPGLRADLDRLLAECDRDDSLIDRAATERFALLLDDAAEELSAVIGDRYVVEREIGRGGMATVFLAHDRKHDRPVAIKVLRREVAASVGADRFLREIRTAARLQHPLIVPVHDSGEAGDFLYYVMPYSRGDSLRDRLGRAPPLQLDEALSTVRDVARALDYAHANGVVHRDIKPGNILLAGGHAMVMDFGIARAVSGSDGNEGATVASIVVGTPAYMAPEQATPGVAVDGRADVYALGRVMSEMVGGDAPAPIERAIHKALAQAPEDRFATATAFADACAAGDLHAASRGTFARLGTPGTGIAAAGVVVVALLASWLAFRDSGNRPAVSPGEAPSVAVLAFKSIGGDSANEALSDGLSEEIAATIARIPGISVKAPRSSFRLKGRQLTIPEIGTTLGVRYLVDGSLQKDARRLRVRVALLLAASDSTLWTAAYDRSVGDMFAIQDDIARAIAGELRVKLAPLAGALARRSTDNAEAHELYLRGRFFFQRRDSASLRKAREYFGRAIEGDSGFALAYAGLSDTYSHGSVFGYAPPRPSMLEARRYADRALALDSTLVEAHSSRAFVANFYEWDWLTAGQSFRKAVTIDPNSPSAHLWRAWYYIATDSVDASIASARTALALEPFLPLNNTRLVSLLYYAHRYDEALQQAQRTFELDSTFFQVRMERARVLLELGRCDEAVAELARVPAQTPAMLQGTRGFILARCGRRAESLAELRRLRSHARSGGNVSHYALAVVHAGLGNRDAAIAELDSAFTERAWTMFLLRVEPAFDSLRNDVRFRRLVMRVGLSS